MFQVSKKSLILLLALFFAKLTRRGRRAAGCVCTSPCTSPMLLGNDHTSELKSSAMETRSPSWWSRLELQNSP